MIWAAIAVAIASAIGASGKGGSLLAAWLSQWRKHLRKHVDDEQRQAAALAIVDAEGKLLSDYLQGVHGRLLDLYEVHRDYDAAREDYSPFVDDLASLFDELQRAHIASTYELLEVLEPEEWTAIQAVSGEQLERYQTRQAKQNAKANKRSSP